MALRPGEIRKPVLHSLKFLQPGFYFLEDKYATTRLQVRKWFLIQIPMQFRVPLCRYLSQARLQ